MVDSTALEMRRAREGTVGSNPTLSATLRQGFGWQATRSQRRRVTSHQRGQVESTKRYLPVALNAYVVVEDELTTRALERYFKLGSGKAFAKKRFLRKQNLD